MIFAAPTLRRSCILFFCLVILVSSLSGQLAVFSPTLEQRIEALLGEMTLDEKIGQMTQVRHFSDIDENDIAEKYIGSIIHTEGPLPGIDAIGWQARFSELQRQALSTRLGIPLLFAVDAIHGQNTYEGATIFPHNIGMGATRNPELIKQAAVITALEVQATGFNWIFGPCIAIPYNEKWGRVYEAYAESPELTSEMAKAAISGYQGQLSDPKTVLATAKHFIGDGATDFGKEGGNTSLNTKEISKRLLPPYKTAVEAGVGAIMVSFNSLGGIPMHVHQELIIDTLKKAWGFDGIVVSDWKGYSRFGGNAVINAGVDVIMAVDGDLVIFQKGLKEGVLKGEVSMERINDAVRRILRQKMRLGLFEQPYPQIDNTEIIGQQSHRKVARQAVRESLVLLKNTNNVLPISTKTKKIVVVGEHAHNAGLQSGGWTINWQGTNRNYKGATTILDGILEMAEGKVVYDSTGSGDHPDADVAIVVVGETPYAEFFGDIGEEKGAHSLTLSPTHQNYIDAYADKKVKLIVVLITGRPLVTTREIEKSDAFIVAWLPGSEGGGLAEVLFGKVNFSGKLPHTWPKSLKDFDCRFGPNYWNPNSKPLFEFGFGLRY